MTREEMWKEFENQLIRETRTPITVSYDVSEKITKSAIETIVAKWKERLELESSSSEKPNKSEISTGSVAKNNLRVDCISRKSVIEIIQNHWWNCRDIDKLVNDLPSVIPQEPSWIPVAERLPEKDAFYLVTEKSGRVCTYVFHKGNSEEYWKRCAVAWMPLPESYKAESEE